MRLGHREKAAAAWCLGLHLTADACDRAASIEEGRAPWRWVRLPGLYEVGIWRWRSEADDGPPIPWVMATRRPEQVSR